MKARALLLAMMLTGCAHKLPQDALLVDGVSAGDGAALSAAIAAYLKNTLPPAQSMVQIAVQGSATGADTIAAPLHARLIAEGFALADAGQSVPQAHRLRYVASRFDNGVLLRVTLDGRQASQYFRTDTTGQLQPMAPMTVEQ